MQDRLGLRKNIGAIDFNLGCSGFVYGLAFAKGLIAGGIAKSILLVTSETYTKHIHPDDKGNRSIFGDASASAIIEKSEGNDYQFCHGNRRKRCRKSYGEKKELLKRLRTESGTRIRPRKYLYEWP